MPTKLVKKDSTTQSLRYANKGPVVPGNKGPDVYWQ